MSRIFITGDLHGEIDIDNLNSKNFPIGKLLTKNDYVIICGDFGLVWSNGFSKKYKQQQYWLHWLNDKPWTTLFVDGNHENFDLLDNYPVTRWNRGNIHKIESSIFHLMRGQIFIIDNKTFFTLGGASSIDKNHRIDHISWWERENISFTEAEESYINLTKFNWEVDFVLTHCAPNSIKKKLYSNKALFEDPNERLLENIKDKLKFKQWFFGHYHQNVNIDEKFFCLYEDKIQI